MFFDLDNNKLGFDNYNWAMMPKGDRRIIRDYVLNGFDRDETLLYGFYDTMYQVRRVEKDYNLEERPRVQVSYGDFAIARKDR